MNQIARCDWLSERARWSRLARSRLPAVTRRQNFPTSHIINPLLTKFVRSRWLDIGLVLSLRAYGPRLRLHKHAKKELGQYPAILTSHLVKLVHLILTHDVITFNQNWHHLCMLNFCRGKRSIQWCPDQSEAWKMHENAQKFEWKTQS